MISSEEALELKKQANDHYKSIVVMIFISFLLNSCDLTSIDTKVGRINDYLVHKAAAAKETPK